MGRTTEAGAQWRQQHLFSNYRSAKRATRTGPYHHELYGYWPSTTGCMYVRGICTKVRKKVLAAVLQAALYLRNARGCPRREHPGGLNGIFVHHKHNFSLSGLQGYNSAQMKVTRQHGSDRYCTCVHESAIIKMLSP